MGWLRRANEWLSRAARGPEPDGFDEPQGADEAPPVVDDPPPERARAPSHTATVVRKVFAHATGVAAPAPDEAGPVLDEEAVAQVAGRVVAHFEANRPEPASFPAMAMQVIELAERVDADLARLVQLIERDSAISAKVLLVANSAMYTRGSEIGTVKDAIGHLGMFAVANIAVGVACRSLYDADARAEVDLYPRHWQEQFLQSMTVGFAASKLASERRLARPDHIFLAGMFHDIGKALALRSLCRLILEGQVARCPTEVVDAVLERAHVLVGTEAHTAWRLPRFLQQVCAHHHDDEVPQDADAMALHVVRVVSGLNAVRVGTGGDKRMMRQVRRSAAALGMSPAEVRALTSEIRESNDRTMEVFGLRD